MTIKLDFEKLNSKDPKVKYGFTKELLEIAAINPGMLYDHFEQWNKMMLSDYDIYKWTAIDIIGYLSAVDVNNKTDEKIKDLIDFIHSGNLIACNHAIFALGLIAQNRSQHKAKIIEEFLRIPEDRFETRECKEVAIGKVLENFKFFILDIKSDEAALKFIREATESHRNATKKKAFQLLERIDKITNPK
jgi:hypothetical protein